KQVSIPTPFAYQVVRKQRNYKSRKIDPFLSWLDTVHKPADFLEQIHSFLWNDFETVLFPQYPLLQEIQDRLITIGVQHPLLSGSGSAVFGFLPMDQARREYQTRHLSEYFPRDDFFLKLTTCVGKVSFVKAM